MDQNPHAALERAEHFAQGVSEVMEAVATLMEGPDSGTLDFTRVPGMFGGCPQCTVEGLLYLAVSTFQAAQWGADRVRQQIPFVVSQVLTSEIV